MKYEIKVDTGLHYKPAPTVKKFPTLEETGIKYQQIEGAEEEIVPERCGNSRKKKYILIGVLFAVTSIGFAIAGLVTQKSGVIAGALMQTAAGMYFLLNGLFSMEDENGKSK